MKLWLKKKKRKCVQCDLYTDSEEKPLQTLTKSLLFHIKIIKCKTIFCVLGSHVLLGRLSVTDRDLENKGEQTDALWPTASHSPPSLYPTRISYCNFKSNTVKSNKKYSVYIKLMSIGILVWDQWSVHKTVKSEEMVTDHKSNNILHTWALTLNSDHRKSQTRNSAKNWSNKDQKSLTQVNSLKSVLTFQNWECIIMFNYRFENQILSECVASCVFGGSVIKKKKKKSSWIKPS